MSPNTWQILQTELIYKQGIWLLTEHPFPHQREVLWWILWQPFPMALRQGHTPKQSDLPSLTQKPPPFWTKPLIFRGGIPMQGGQTCEHTEGKRQLPGAQPASCLTCSREPLPLKNQKGEPCARSRTSHCRRCSMYEPSSARHCTTPSSPLP